MFEKGHKPKHNVNGVKRVLSTHDEEALRNEIIEWLLNGYSKSHIIKFYQDSRGLNEYYLVARYNEACNEIRTRASVDHEIILHVHVDFYEQIFRYFEETNNVYGKRKALYSKERLLGLHKEDNNIEVNNTTNIELEQDAVYNLEKLLPEEKNKVNLLLSKIGHND